MNPYQVLGVARNATRSQIKSQFYRLSLLHHPDLNGNEGAGDEFLRLQEAYSLLMDRERRRMWDRLNPESIVRRPIVRRHDTTLRRTRPAIKDDKLNFAWRDDDDDAQSRLRREEEFIRDLQISRIRYLVVFGSLIGYLAYCFIKEV